jgi:hypothetical protein
MLKRELVALWCLAAATGCAKVTEDAATAAAAATVTVPAAVVAARSAVDAATPASAPVVAADVLTGGSQESIEEQTAAEVQAAPPAVATADPEVPALEEPAALPVAPAALEPERAPDPVEPSLASPALAATLDVQSLLTRLRKTKAISLRTKLAVKGESDELLDQFRAYHSQRGTTTLPELRQSYDLLFRKLYSLFEDDDPPLAHDIARSHAAIWEILADPVRFGSPAAIVSTRARVSGGADSGG